MKTFRDSREQICREALDTDLALSFWRAVLKDPEWKQARGTTLRSVSSVDPSA